MRTRFRPALVAGLLGALALTGCGAAHLPEVTFYGNYTAVNTGPVLWCDVDYVTETGSCGTVGEAARIRLEKGQPLQINVPGSIGPWQVVYQYAQDGLAKPVIAGSGLLFSGELAYTVRVEPGQQILNAEVQAAPLQVSGDAEGTKEEYVYTQVWAILNDSSELLGE